MFVRCLCVAVLSSLVASSALAVDFKGKTIQMVVGAEPGGGTDAASRLVVPYFEKYLPGNPTIVIRNRPGAGGVTALNYIVQQTAPDGLTVIGGGNAQLSPITYRKANGIYDPRDFIYLGGLGRGGTVLIVNKDHEPRLYDKSQPPVFFGALDGTRSGEQVVFWGMEYLGWNVKVVVGYRGTNDLSIATERGEVDMHTTSNMFIVDKLMKTGNFRIMAQSGSLIGGKFVERPEFPGVPVLADIIGAKITSPVEHQAFEYWQAFAATEKWLGLRMGTPEDIVAVYRTAFEKMIADPDFIARTTGVADEMTPQAGDDVKALVGKMAALSPEAEQFLKDLSRKHGLNTQ
ncbi:MAG TPA: tripartite tricarboxylate transporter substrate-binding protein [Alphaproteobacteria bacterium]|jgi:tripartite-type tricarboxylate transporter receptor subunit TctC|nr:tripartite tricarboxylate transporter substrate-binding protein [Alphaproteobacteria bacterium]